MKYELQYFDVLVEQKLQPGSKDLNDNQYAVLADEITSEVERIKTSFHQKIFSLQNEALIELDLRSNQAAIIRRIDQFSKDFKRLAYDKRTPEDLTIRLADQVVGSLEEILSYMETSFSKYFNTAENIPENQRRMAARDFRKRLKIFYKDNEDFSKIDLFKIAIYPIEKFVGNGHKKISFKRLMYLKELFLKIESLPEKAKNDPEKQDTLLINNLIYLNYNSFHFFAYLIHFISATIKKLDTVNDRIEKLVWFRKQVSQAQIKPGMQLKMKRLSIKILLYDWLTEELDYYERKKQLLSKPASELTSTLPKGFKIKTDFSVPQVACFIKLLIESDVIKNENITETLHFYSAFTQTKNTANISPESMRTKYYNIEDSTRKAIRDVLVRMLKDTNQHLLN